MLRRSGSTSLKGFFFFRIASVSLYLSGQGQAGANETAGGREDVAGGRSRLSERLILSSVTCRVCAAEPAFSRLTR